MNSCREGEPEKDETIECRHPPGTIGTEPVNASPKGCEAASHAPGWCIDSELGLMHLRFYEAVARAQDPFYDHPWVWVVMFLTAPIGLAILVITIALGR